MSSFWSASEEQHPLWHEWVIRGGYRFFFLSNTGAKPVLLKRYQCLNGALTNTWKKKHKTTIDIDDIKNGYQTAKLVACASS